MIHTDRQIKTDIVNRLHWDTRIDAPGVFVNVNDGVVTLTGTVCTYSAKKVAHEIASLTKGVVCLDNRLIRPFPALL